MNRLDEIIAQKRKEIVKLLPREDLLRHAAAERNDFRSLSQEINCSPERLGLIAEVKKASPSAGTIAHNFDPELQATLYDQAGVSCISVLTDEKYFGGRLEYLTRIRQKVQCPVLRKDFIIHPAQIYEAVVAGADAILLIVAALTKNELQSLMDISHTFQLECLVEVHNREELDTALDTDARIIGINNRNLKTFEVDLGTTERLAEEVPEDDGYLVISESGIKTVEDAKAIATWGVDALLVGETLMRSEDPDQLAAQFMEIARHRREENAMIE